MARRPCRHSRADMEARRGAGAGSRGRVRSAGPRRAAFGRDRLALGVVGDHVGQSETIAARPSASSAWWRSIATASRWGRFQRLASTPPTSAWSMPSWSRSSRSRCSGVLADSVEVGAPPRMEAHHHQPADVVQERGDGELIAFGPADCPPDPIGGMLRREGVHAEALGAQVAAAVLLEEVEDRRGAGDGEHSRGLEHVDGLWDRGRAAVPGVPVGGAQHGHGQGDVRLDRLDHLGDTRGLRGRRLHHPRLGLDQDRKAVDRLEGRREASPRRRFVAPGGDGVSPALPVCLCAPSMPSARLGLSIGSEGRSV